MARTNTTLFAFAVALAALGCNDPDAMTDPDAGALRDGGEAPSDDGGALRDGGEAPSDDGGAIPTAPHVELEIADACAPSSPCGGDVIGTWEYADGCVEADLDSVRDACPAATIDATATATGRVRIEATTIERAATVWTEAQIEVPAECALLGCASLAELLAGEGDAACLDDGRGGCDCTLRHTRSIIENDGYHLEGDSLVTDSGRSYPYCRDGDAIVHGERDGADVFTLTRL